MEPLAILNTHIFELKNQFQVQELGVFGSFATGKNNPDSDIDIMVKFEKGSKTFDNFMNLKFYLEELLKRPIDLVTEESIRPQNKAKILDEIKYAKEL